MLDILIKGGLLLDGTGKKSFKASIGISKGKIVEISEDDVSGNQATDRIIDAEGRFVSPGFIDVHSHSDLSLLVDPLAQSKVRQGVTTEINGNCGFGVAPLPKKESLKEFENFWRSSGSEWFGLKPSWESFGEYLDALQNSRPALNTSILAAHGSIRFLAMGDSPRKATEDELAKMEAIVEDCMKSGACGLSSGLRYSPACYAGMEELVRICKVVKKYGGIYATHMRSEGDNGSWIEAVQEAVFVASKAGLPLQISHLKALSKNVWNTSGEILQLCARLRASGMDLNADMYPYDAAHTGLTVFLPKWVVLDQLKALGFEKRKELLDHIRGILEMRGGPQRIIIISSPGHALDGKNIEDLQREMHLASPEETILKLIENSGGEISIISRSMNEEDIQRIMKTDYVMISTDGYSISPEGPSAIGIPHPRSYGTYPRVLGRYARELRLLTFEDAVRKMTSLPAEKFQLKDRGTLKEGSWADIVVFDPSEIIDTSTFSSPKEYPRGIDYVLVNGEVVIDKTEGHTLARPGKVLRLSGWVT